MLKPVQFLKPRNVNGPLYQVGDVAGFMPDLAAQLVADGSARETVPGESPEPPAAAAPAPKPERVIPVSGYPYASSEERQAARKNNKPRR